MDHHPHLSIRLHRPLPPLLSWSHCCRFCPLTSPDFPLALFPHSAPRGRENQSGLFGIVIRFFPPSGFVTAAANPVLSIFTSCSGYALSIYVGIKCAILHSLFLHCFNVNMLHMKSCPFSPSKPFTLVSWYFFPPAILHTLLKHSSENLLL